MIDAKMGLRFPVMHSLMFEELNDEVGREETPGTMNIEYSLP